MNSHLPGLTPIALVPLCLAAAGAFTPALAGEASKASCQGGDTLASATAPAPLIAQAGTGRKPRADYAACTYRVPPVPQIQPQPVRGLF
ncbi:MAG: hypothetical protein AB1Z22_00820 [Synechococcaceae cyanobacterium]